MANTSGAVKTLSVKRFVRLFQQSYRLRKQPFCFVLGAGASKTAGILTGIELARKWMAALREELSAAEIERLRKECRLSVEEIATKSSYDASRNYENIYRMYFHDDLRNGYAFLEEAMKKAKPSYGHYPLAQILTKTTSNLVITTNFDSMVEDALFTYSDQKPLVVGHESLVQFVDISGDRPVVAKVHRSLFYDPINATNNAEKWHASWAQALNDIFKKYTPIVIGYNGGDHTFMDYLENENCHLPGLYWCYRGDDNEPDERIQKIVKKHHGCFVKIEISAAFDYFMFELSRAFEYESPAKMLLEKVEWQISHYNEQGKELDEELRRIENPTEAQEEAIDSWREEQLEHIEKLSKAIHEYPQSAYAYRRRGTYFSDLSEYENAIDDYTKSIELDSSFALAYVLRGDCYFLQKNYEAALIDYCTAIELKPNKESYYVDRARVYDKLNEPEKAEADRKKAKELREGND